MTDATFTLHSIRLERAREPGHPEGSASDGYEFTAPLTGDGRIDVGAWRAARQDCLVRRFRRNAGILDGRLARKPGGAWFFDYDRTDDADDETGFRFGEETFVVGDYVSLKESDGMHTYRVVLVEPV